MCGRLVFFKFLSDFIVKRGPVCVQTPCKIHNLFLAIHYGCLTFRALSSSNFGNNCKPLLFPVELFFFKKKFYKSGGKLNFLLESEVKEFTIFANLMLNVQWILMNIILKYVHTFLFTRENFLEICSCSGRRSSN